MSEKGKSVAGVSTETSNEEGGKVWQADTGGKQPSPEVATTVKESFWDPKANKSADSTQAPLTSSSARGRAATDEERSWAQVVQGVGGFDGRPRVHQQWI